MSVEGGSTVSVIVGKGYKVEYTIHGDMKLVEVDILGGLDPTTGQIRTEGVHIGNSPQKGKAETQLPQLPQAIQP